jgi:hypothetical protein
MTGRGAGFCAGYAAPGYANPAVGQGLGFGQGRGRGLGGARGFCGGRRWGGAFAAPGGYAAPIAYAPPVAYAAQNAPQELDALKAQAGTIAKTLEGIQQRIAELESDKSE